MLGLVAMQAFSLVAMGRDRSSGVLRGLLIAGLSLVVEHGLQGMRASAVAARGLSSCGSRARKLWYGARVSLLHGMRDSPEPGTEPLSPARAGPFLSPAPPGEP